MFTRFFKKKIPEVAFSGWKKRLISLPRVESLSDDQLQELNSLFNWQCFVVDSKGRRFGKPARGSKRSEPQIFPDRRLKLLEERIPLADLHVVEVGCFEGIHTAGLCEKAKKVTAIDSRVENVTKTIIRAHFFDSNPNIFTFDLEQIDEVNCQIIKCDLIHHIGVLYHLSDPVKQLMLFEKYVKSAIFLDTHYATPEMANLNYTTSQGTFDYYHYRESGYGDAFSGMADHAKWLKLDDITTLLKAAGFGNIEVIEKRDERNGPRVLLLACR